MTAFLYPTPKLLQRYRIMNLGIVCASPAEAKPLTGFDAEIGRIYSIGQSSFLAVSGAGSKNAGNAADVLLNDGVQALISWGFAVGLQSSLHAGDVVLAEILVTEQSSYKVSRSWRTAMRKRLADFTRVYDGALAHCESVLSRPVEKKILRDSSSAIAVDRESAAVAARAKRAKIPFLALKVIAESASMRLPSALSERISESGSLGPAKIIQGAGARPWAWPAGIKLTRSAVTGLDKLRYIAMKLDRDLTPPRGARRVRTRKPSPELA